MSVEQAMKVRVGCAKTAVTAAIRCPFFRPVNFRLSVSSRHALAGEICMPSNPGTPRTGRKSTDDYD